MTTVFKRLVDRFKADGAASTIKQCIGFVLRRLRLIEDVEGRRLFLSNKINKLFDSTIAYGPLKGFVFSRHSWWGRYDRAPMILGLYEREVLASIINKTPTHNVFIDIGAADGYYGVGLIYAGFFEKSYCFETSSRGRKVIADNAIVNNVSDCVEIFGHAQADFFEKIPEQERSKAVVLVDIEGGEFDIFTEKVFMEFKNSIILIETHSWAVEDFAEKLNMLKSKAKKYFNISELKTASRDLSAIEELASYRDTDRWLMCSEGRPCLMTWLRLEPLSL